MAYTDLTSDNAERRQASKRLIETTLENIAPAVFRGACLVYIDIGQNTGMARKLGLQRE